MIRLPYNGYRMGGGDFIGNNIPAKFQSTKITPKIVISQGKLKVIKMSPCYVLHLTD